MTRTAAAFPREPKGGGQKRVINVFVCSEPPWPDPAVGKLDYPAGDSLSPWCTSCFMPACHHMEEQPRPADTTRPAESAVGKPPGIQHPRDHI